MITPRRIILHHSATKDNQTFSWNDIRRYHTVTRGWRDIGYHFGIEDIEGGIELIVGRFVGEIGAHCKGYNSDSVGICMVGNWSLESPDKYRWEKCLTLVRHLMFFLYIPREQVFGHRELAATECPGLLFNIDQFRRDL